MDMLRFGAVASAAVCLATSSHAAVIWSGTVGAGDLPTISTTLPEAYGTYLLTTDGTLLGPPVVTYNLTVERLLLQQDGQEIALPTVYSNGHDIGIVGPWILPIAGGYEIHLYGANGTVKVGGPPLGTDTGFSFVRTTYTTTFDIAAAFSPESVGANYSLDALGAVPEPATWALMILGFGFAGAALRQRRRVAA